MMYNADRPVDGEVAHATLYGSRWFHFSIHCVVDEDNHYIVGVQQHLACNIPPASKVR